MGMKEIKIDKKTNPFKILDRNILKHCYNCEHHMEYHDSNLNQIKCMCCNLDVKDDDFHDYDCLKAENKDIRICVGWEERNENNN